MELLKDQGANWYGIGIRLKLTTATLDKIESKTKESDIDRRLTEVIDNWLKWNYNHERFGPPTWEKLVEAVRSPSGGNDAALAEKIANLHSRGECSYNVQQE